MYRDIVNIQHPVYARNWLKIVDCHPDTQVEWWDDDGMVAFWAYKDQESAIQALERWHAGRSESPGQEPDGWHFAVRYAYPPSKSMRDENGYVLTSYEYQF